MVSAGGIDRNRRGLQPERTASMSELSAWVGRNETVHDTLSPTPVAALTAILDHSAAQVPTGDALPPAVALAGGRQ